MTELFTSEVANYLLMASLSLFLVEVVIFVQLKKQIQESDPLLFDAEVEKILRMLQDMGPEHLLIYSTIYLTGVLLCRFFPVLYAALISLQVVSLLMDIYLFRKLFK